MVSEQEIPQLKKEIGKHLKSKNMEAVLEILDTLESLKITTEILKSSRVGVFVTDLRKHPNCNDEVKSKCKALVLKWKSEIGRLPPVRQASGDSSSSNSVEGQEQSAPIIERNVATDGVKIPSYNNKVRGKCTEMLYAALATDSHHKSDLILSAAVAIEKAVYLQFNDVSASYKSKIRMLVSNLKDKGNPELNERVLSGDISFEKFSKMSADELMSKNRKEVVKELHKATMSDVVTPKMNHAETDMFKCGRCKQRRCTYYQMQTRSADEPMTTFVTCQNCNNRWKFC